MHRSLVKRWVRQTREKIVEPGNGWERGEGWSKIVQLIELDRRPDPSEWNAALRERILQKVLAKVEADRQRRRLKRTFLAGAASALVVGWFLGLVSAGVPWLRTPASSDSAFVANP
jgi:hypothetical protein